MEKPGMGGGTPVPGAGLLGGLFRGALFLALWTGILRAPVFPQEAPTVLGEASPASILAGSFWNLTLLVDHPSPEEVEVRLPPLPRGLSLDRARKESRVLPQSGPEGEPEAARRWTALQYRFLARTPGRIDLPPLEVRVRGLSVQSSGFSVTVRNPPPRPDPLRLVWRDPPRSLTVGEESLLILGLSGRNPPELPAEGLPPPPVPSMAIMESLPPREEGQVLVLRIIPLEGPLFVLPGFPLSLDTGVLEAPALSIPVSPAPRRAAGLSGTGTREPPPPASPQPAPPSAPPEASPASPPPPAVPPPAPPPGTAPGEKAKALPPFPLSPVGAGGRKVQERSRALWEGGQALEALAELRRNERDHPAGFTLVPQRRELERALGLGRGADEIFRPRILLVPALVLCLILAALGLTVPAMLPRALGRRGRDPPVRGPRASIVRALTWIFRTAGLLFTLAALFCLLRLTVPLPGDSLSYRRAARQALARDTPVYRVPEDTGTEIARFREGQGILVYEIRGQWAYAESVEDRDPGWIRVGTYLVY